MSDVASPNTPSPSSPRTADGRPLFLPPGQNYECIQCGRSCGEFWDIAVEPEKAEEIRARPIEALAAARSPARCIVESAYDPGKLVMRLEGRACCLQTGGGLCSLHAAFGLKSKPAVCQSFPYRFVETPSGVYAGTSFACTAVLGNLGPPVSDQADYVASVFALGSHARKIVDPPDLAVDIPLTWEQYEAIEADLDSLLIQDAAAPSPIQERLLAQTIYLDLLAKYLRQTRQKLGRAAEDANTHGAALEIFRRQMREGGTAWERIRKIAARPRSSPLLRRAALSAAHELRNVYGRRRGRIASAARLVAIYFRAGFGLAKIDLPALDRAIPVAALEEVAFDPASPEMDELLARYFRARLQRKDLLTGDDLLFALRMQMLYWGLIQWYAAALAIGAGRAAIALDDLREALRNVEKYYIYHSTMERVLNAFPMLRGFLDRLLAQRLFPFSMARGGWSAGRKGGGDGSRDG